MCMQAGKADVLVATDVASKGLDFPDIQHVINFDMPSEIENYVHRIGRTGRCGKTGIATTFINKNQSESILLDLKHLLKEAKQRIPPVLMVSHHCISLCLHGANNICLACCGTLARTKAAQAAKDAAHPVVSNSLKCTLRWSSSERQLY